MRRLGVVCAVLLLALPAGADETVLGSTLEFIPASGTAIEVEGRLYEGSVLLRIHSDGIAVTERTAVDRYLLGIREVPFSWESSALEAQAVAARTYLAWTLHRGRSRNGRKYGYDICATTSCQVYAGVGGLSEASGSRWKRAVEATTGQILVYGGRPAQALYSSTTGGRTRSVEDVFGSSAVPYLTAVDSPDENSPFVDWVFGLTEADFQLLLEGAGVVDSPITGVEMVPTADGGGQTRVRFTTASGEVEIGTWDLRTSINRADGVLGDRLPAVSPSGRRYPQTIMSPTYEIERKTFYLKLFGSPPVPRTWYRISGHGWGHLVGMSQYGAQAMAKKGASYSEILGHYFTGLIPTDGSSWLPSHVTVGLSTGLESISLRPDGPVTVRKDGVAIGTDVLGSWQVSMLGDRLAIVPPVGLGLAPDLEGWRIGFNVAGSPTEARIVVPTAAEIRLIVKVGGVVTRDDGWVLVDASIQDWEWRDLIGPLRFDQPVDLILRARNPQGEDTASIRLIPGLK